MGFATDRIILKTMHEIPPERLRFHLRANCCQRESQDCHWTAYHRHIRTTISAQTGSAANPQVGQVARLDFALQLGNISETVEVHPQAPSLDTENNDDRYGEQENSPPAARCYCAFLL